MTPENNGDRISGPQKERVNNRENESIEVESAPTQVNEGKQQSLDMSALMNTEDSDEKDPNVHADTRQEESAPTKVKDTQDLAEDTINSTSEELISEVSESTNIENIMYRDIVLGHDSLFFKKYGDLITAK